jgi:RNA polymerase sigma-70 factor (ECF subfamily)
MGASRELADAESDTSETSPEAHASRREFLTILERGFSALSGQDRGLLTLRYREGFSDAEVARIYRLPVNTVKTRIFRARAQLVRYVRRSLGGDHS